MIAFPALLTAYCGLRIEQPRAKALDALQHHIAQCKGSRFHECFHTNRHDRDSYGCLLLDFGVQVGDVQHCKLCAEGGKEGGREKQKTYTYILHIACSNGNIIIALSLARR